MDLSRFHSFSIGGITKEDLLVGSEGDFDESNSLTYSLGLKFASLECERSKLLEGFLGFALELGLGFDCTEKESFMVGIFDG